MSFNREKKKEGIPSKHPISTALILARNNALIAGNKTLIAGTRIAQAIVALPLILPAIATEIATMGNSNPPLEKLKTIMSKMNIPVIEAGLTTKLAKYEVLTPRNWWETITHPSTAHLMEEIFNDLEKFNLVKNNKQNVDILFQYAKYADKLYLIIEFIKMLIVDEKGRFIELVLQNAEYSPGLAQCINLMYDKGLLLKPTSDTKPEDTFITRNNLEIILSLGSFSKDINKMLEEKIKSLKENEAIKQEDFHNIILSIKKSTYEEIPILSDDPKKIVLSYLFKTVSEVNENKSIFGLGLS